MQKYEMLYIINSALKEEEIDNTTKKVEEMITKNGGVILSVDKSGIKKFAYPINDRNEGYYVLVNFESDSTAPKAIGNQMNIIENIVRQMIVAK